LFVGEAIHQVRLSSSHRTSNANDLQWTRTDFLENLSSIRMDIPLQGVIDLQENKGGGDIEASNSLACSLIL
jgi:hypothetical protein